MRRYRSKEAESREQRVGFFALNSSLLSSPLFHSLLLCSLLSACSSGSPGKESSTKFKQYYIKGEQLYLKHCSNCHQKNGTGLGLLFPPLHQSDYMDNHFEDVLCSIRYGKSGELIVNGKSFNKEMPPIPSLTDLEIAEIATFIYNSWDHKRGLVDVKETTGILNGCQ